MDRVLKLQKANQDVYWGLSKQEFYGIIDKITSIITLNDEYYQTYGLLSSKSVSEGTGLLKTIIKQQATRVGRSKKWENVLSEAELDAYILKKFGVKAHSPKHYEYRMWYFNGWKSASKRHYDDISESEFRNWFNNLRRSRELATTI